MGCGITLASPIRMRARKGLGLNFDFFRAIFFGIKIPNRPVPVYTSDIASGVVVAVPVELLGTPIMWLSHPAY
jgi:hypothetical protein